MGLGEKEKGGRGVWGEVVRLKIGLKNFGNNGRDHPKGGGRCG